MHTNDAGKVAEVAALGGRGQEAAQVAVRSVQLILQLGLQRLRMVRQPDLCPMKSQRSVPRTTSAA